MPSTNTPSKSTSVPNAKLAKIAKAKAFPENIIYEYEAPRADGRLVRLTYAIGELEGIAADDCQVGTLASPFAAGEDPADPNVVKVVLDSRGRALYFSRAPIPHDGSALKHIGLYVYRPDFLARYGGEEFTIILPSTSRGEALAVAEKIRSRVERYPFRGRETQPNGSVTISIGVSTFPEDGMDTASLMESADQALYEAKESGRNKVC